MVDAEAAPDTSVNIVALASAKSAETTTTLEQRYTPAHLCALLSLGQTWVWETDADHRFSFISSAMEAATGLFVKDSIGRTRRECFFGDSTPTPAMLAHLDDLENHREFSDFIFRSSGKTQKKLWVAVSGTPRFDTNGRFIGYIGISRGLSEQAIADSGLKNAADQLARVETLLTDVIASVPDGIALWDKNGVLVMCNQNFRGMIAVNVPVQTGDSYQDIMRRVLAGGEVLNVEGSIDEWLAEDLRTMREDATIEDVYELPNQRWILRRVMCSPNGERVDIRTDITELKNNEEKIKSALEEAVLARTVINDLSEPVFVKDADLRFVFGNDAFAAIVNRKGVDLPGRRAIDFVNASDAKAFENSEQEVLLKGGTFELEEDYFEDGLQKTRILRKSRITTTSGQNYLAGFMFDVTALRKRERAMENASRRAESADKAKSDFLAQMSHEIRTPMNGVLSMTELLVQSTLDDRQRVFVDIIRKSGESLLSTINAILDFTQIEGGSLALGQSPFPLRAAIEDIAEMMVAKANEKDTDVIINIAPELPACLIGDEGRIRQIISNLVSNAIKFTENGQISIAVTGRAMEAGAFNLSIKVADTGIGIPADKIGQIFHRFAQVSTAENTKQQGTGLGLSIVSKLVGLMGGTIRVESELGLGSTFYVDIPLQCADLRAPATPVLDHLRKKRILIIDSKADWRASLADPLKHWGFDVAAVEGAQTAIAMAKALHQNGQRIDLVLIGCEPLGLTCVEIARAIDASWPTDPSPKLLLAPINGNVSPQTKSECRVHSVLSLPLKQASLYHHVISALEATDDLNAAPSRQAYLPKTPDKTKPQISQALASDIQISQVQASHIHSLSGHASRVDVLIAEDNPVNQLVFAQILSGTGLAYQIVANGQLAVEAFAEMQPGLILMDIGLPKLSGFEATRAIRAMASLGGANVPIIAVTASVPGEDRESCLKAGMDDHLAKPLSPEALLAKIATWLPKPVRKTA